MHCKGYLITKEIPTEQKLNRILEKYSSEKVNDEKFEWDWWQIGGRYGGKIKIKFNPDENEDKYYCGRDRNHKYFISNILDDIKINCKWYEELDYLQYMGLNDNILYVDGGYYSDMLEFEIDNCYLVIDDEENLYVREVWENGHWIEDNDFDNKVKNIDLKRKFITVIDFHY